jgi:anti-sigma factor RsiW
MTSELPDQPCREFVEQVTDYLEDALTPYQRARVEQHLGRCEGCRTVLAQWRETVRLTGRLADSDVAEIDPATRNRLIASFRRVHRR